MRLWCSRGCGERIYIHTTQRLMCFHSEYWKELLMKMIIMLVLHALTLADFRMCACVHVFLVFVWPDNMAEREYWTGKTQKRLHVHTLGMFAGGYSTHWGRAGCQQNPSCQSNSISGSQKSDFCKRKEELSKKTFSLSLPWFVLVLRSFACVQQHHHY